MMMKSSYPCDGQSACAMCSSPNTYVKSLEGRKNFIDWATPSRDLGFSLTLLEQGYRVRMAASVRPCIHTGFNAQQVVVGISVSVCRKLGVVAHSRYLSPFILFDKE